MTDPIAEAAAEAAAHGAPATVWHVPKTATVEIAADYEHMTVTHWSVD